LDEPDPFGKAPFDADRGAFNFGPIPEEVRYVEDWPRRMRAMFAGETVLDSRCGKMLHRTGTFPTWLFPLEDLRDDLLVAAEPGRRWTLRVGDCSAHDAVTCPTGRRPGRGGTARHGQVDYAVIDRWLEEDDPIYAHPRDPYHRVDVRSSSRHVTVRHGGCVIAESRRPKLLFESSNPIRYYLPFADVRIELLQLSDTVSECDVAWSLPHPLPEGIAAAEHVGCYPGKVNIDVDGQPITEWPSGSRRPERSLSCPRLRQQCAPSYRSLRRG